MAHKIDIAKRLRFHEFPPGEWFSTVTSVLGSVQTKHRELKYTFYNSFDQPFNETNFVFELQFNKKSELISSRIGAAYSNAIEHKLLVSLSNLESTEEKVIRFILFSQRPVNRFFSFKDKFQILPVPSSASKPITLVGDHPFIVEIKSNTVTNAQVQARRLLELKTEYIGILNLLFSTTVYSVENKSQWCISENLSSSFHGTTGYFIQNFETHKENFSNTKELLPMNFIETKKYYSKWYSANEVEAPEHLELFLERYFLLPKNIKLIFKTALHWLDRADAVYVDSKSLAYLALVTTIESMLGADEVGGKCGLCGVEKKKESIGSKFRGFVDAFAPGVTNSSRKSLYDLRSKIVHKGRIIGSDSNPFSFWMNPKVQDELESFRLCRSVVRISLINWLYSWDDLSKGWWGAEKLGQAQGNFR